MISLGPFVVAQLQCALDRLSSMDRSPTDVANEAVRMLEELAALAEHGDVVGSAIADDVLGDVAIRLWESGLLDRFIRRASALYWPSARISDPSDTDHAGR